MAETILILAIIGIIFGTSKLSKTEDQGYSDGKIKARREFEAKLNGRDCTRG